MFSLMTIEVLLNYALLRHKPAPSFNAKQIPKTEAWV